MCTPVRAEVQPQRFIVGVEDTQYLPHYAYENDQWSGFAARLLNKFAATAGYQFEYKSMPVERLVRSFTRGQVDFKYPASPDWKRQQKKGLSIHYSLPVIDYLDGVSLLPENLSREQSAIRTLGIVRGFTPSAWRSEIERSQVLIEENDSFPALVQQALRGRVDAVYADAAAVRYQVRQLQQEGGETGSLVFAHKLPFVAGSYRFASIQHPNIVTEFNRWLADNKSWVEQLKRAYFN